MKKFLLFISFCLLCLSQIGAVVTYTEDCTKNPFKDFPTTAAGANYTGASVTNTDLIYTLSGGTRCNFNSSGKCVILGKKGAYIIFPTFENGSIQEIRITLSSGSSAADAKFVEINSDNTETEISASATMTKVSPNKYSIPSEKQGNGKKYKFQITSSHNVQITKIEIDVEEGAVTPKVNLTTTAKDVMENGEEFTISTSTEGATLSYTIDGTENWIPVEGNTVPLYAPTKGESFTIKAKATKVGYEDGTLEKTVTLYPPTPTTALIDEVILTDTKVTGTAYKDFSNVIKYGAEYAGKCAGGNSSIQFNNNTTSGKGSAIFMTQSVGNVNKVVVAWNDNTKSGRKLQVYGQNTPYEAYTSDETKYIGADAVKGDLLGTIECGTSTELYITGEYQYILVMEAGEGVLYLNSIKFIWNNPFTGSETTYNMENGTSNIKTGKFVTLVDTQNGKALSRNNAAEGTIAGAAATVNNDESNGGKFVTLNQNQIFIDEFQLVLAEGGFKLYGGTPFIRRYIGVDATGLTTTTDETAAAVVKFVQYGDGIVAQFTDGDYIVSDGTNFGKGNLTGTEAPASLTEGATLVPAYVFVSKGNNSTGVEDIEMVETEAPAQYYNLNGVEVKAGNLVPGIYIVRQGNKVSKQFIR